MLLQYPSKQPREPLVAGNLNPQVIAYKSAVYEERGDAAEVPLQEPEAREVLLGSHVLCMLEQLMHHAHLDANDQPPQKHVPTINDQHEATQHAQRGDGPRTKPTPFILQGLRCQQLYLLYLPGLFGGCAWGSWGTILYAPTRTHFVLSRRLRVSVPRVEPLLAVPSPRPREVCRPQRSWMNTTNRPKTEHRRRASVLYEYHLAAHN
mmetsp:Transcript_19928/g.43607  ORF Transcript_19928/g.43607 Transcript_19928/m.43607 type:complete len:207 (+) Transcript_19928:1057-1677(+)